jgi:hypothetical protein
MVFWDGFLGWFFGMVFWDGSFGMVLLDSFLDGSFGKVLLDGSAEPSIWFYGDAEEVEGCEMGH